ncbi:MAG: hypothetical protein HQ521_17955 [Bacteroidetes bacterium]|nr:hypothetical protein [Bacteroidota bacterium]
MRIISILLVSIFTVVISFSGCKKKDETPKNQMTYNEVEYDLSHGVSENNGIWDGNEGYNFNLILLSSGFTVYEVDGKIDSLSGIGHGILFELYSNNSDKLDDGVYTFEDGPDGKPGTFSYADAVFNWDAQTLEGTEVEATTGNLSVVKAGDEYELSMNLTMKGGKTLTGFYKGILKYYISDQKSVKKENIWSN